MVLLLVPSTLPHQANMVLLLLLSTLPLLASMVPPLPLPL
jgi:hypothetical protein